MYGANKALFELMRELSQNKDYQLYLVIPAEGEMTEALSALGVQCEICAMTQWQGIYTDPLRFAVKKAIRKKEIQKELLHLYQRYKDEGIDLIHSNSSVLGTGAMLAERLGCQHIWHIREFSREHYGMQYFYRAARVRELYEKANVLVAISDALAENYRQNYPKANVVRVYDGVSSQVKTNQDEKTKKRKENENENENENRNENPCFRFCYLGYLFPKKHQLDVIKAANLLWKRNIKNFEVYLIGDGKAAYTKKLKKQIAAFGLTSIKLLGYRTDAQQLLEDMQVGIIASTYEGFGLVTIEYMLHGLPVIGRNSGATPELVKDGETGFLYDSVEELADAMEFFMTNQAACHTMGEAGRHRAKQYFSMEKHRKAMEQLYQLQMDETGARL